MRTDNKTVDFYNAPFYIRSGPTESYAKNSQNSRLFRILSFWEERKPVESEIDKRSGASSNFYRILRQIPQVAAFD
jgi:hypothetical protein